MRMEPLLEDDREKTIHGEAFLRRVSDAFPQPPVRRDGVHAVGICACRYALAPSSEPYAQPGSYAEHREFPRCRIKRAVPD